MKTNWLSVVIASIVLLLVVSLASCTSTPSSTPVTPADSEITKLESQLTSLQTELESKNSSLEELQSQNDQKTAEIETLKAEISQKSERIAELEQQVNEQTKQITELENERATLKANAAKTNNATSFTVENVKDLAYFLIVNYGLCETSLGRTYFTFDILENDSSYTPYDYWIQVEYDSSFFNDLKYSKDITTEMNQKVCEELKAHQEKLAKAVIELIPDKKFWGGYYDSWYRYPTLEVDLITRHYYSWVNYTPASIALADYDETKVSKFQWYPNIDDDLTR